MSNRIVDCFSRLRSAKRKAFVAYLSAGDPHLEATPGLVWALERAGADVVELGVPFSDPLADGVVNQQAAQRALEAGSTVTGLLEAVRKIRTQSSVPLVLFTYLNPIYRFGLENFAREAQQAGADGMLLLDLPPEETLIRAKEVEQTLCRICLIAPTTPRERLGAIARAASGFIYYVSREGVTGMQTQVAQGVSGQVEAIRAETSTPICVGFGISNPEQARVVAGVADGVVVGSALVSKIGEWGREPDLVGRLENFARPFAEAIHSV
jgi:tryptophan synthase alpha chain